MSQESKQPCITDPDARQIEVLTLSQSVDGEGEIATSPLLTGLRIAVNDIFAGV
jgi:hypothetical protein